MFKLSKSKNLNLLSVYLGAKHIYDDIPYIKRRRRLKRAFFVLKIFLILFLLFFIIGFISFVFYFKDVKNLYTTMVSGKRNIEEAVNLLLNENFEEGKIKAGIAQSDFSQANELAQKYDDNFLIKNISYFNNQINDVLYLTSSAEIISKTIEQSSNYAEAFEKVLANKEKNFNKLSEEEKIALLDILFKSTPDLVGIKANIDLALLNLNYLKFSGILLPYKTKISNLREKLETVKTTLDTIIPLSQFVPIMLGYPAEADYLLVLQNSDELRPSGGFVGTYGIAKTKNGDIVNLETHDVYHLDIPVQDIYQKEPPAPLKEYLGVDNWYFRDANWYPDWPSSAQNLEQFFYEEDSLLPEKNKINNYDGNFEGIIAITPKIIVDLLEQIGPIYVEDTEFNHTNFINLLQYKVEQEYIQLGVREWHRKEIIAEIVKEIKIKLFNLEPNAMYTILNVISKNLNEKNIQIYFKDVELEKLLVEKNWAGAIQNYNGDYLMVVDANMASYKTDAVINRSIGYKVRKNNTGELISNLALNYAHNGDFDWKTTRYRTYTRVYVPRGSQLINATGMDNSDIKVYDEYNKTVYAFFLNVEPGEIGNISIDYKLPDDLRQSSISGKYNLYLQKQAGNTVDDLKIDLDLNANIKEFSPNGFLVDRIDKNNIVWETSLRSDLEINLKIDN